MPEFKIHSPYQMAGDQPEAVAKLVEGHFNGDAVAETLLHDLEEQQRIWLTQKG